MQQGRGSEGLEDHVAGGPGSSMEKGVEEARTH